MGDTSTFWNTAKRKTAAFILGAALLSIGTPLVVAFTQPGARPYLLQPMIFEMQSVPILLAAALWLPWPSAWAIRAGLILARLLFISSALFYVPILTGILPTGGDMIGLGYFLFAAVTTAAVLVITIVVFGVAAFFHRRRLSEVTATDDPQRSNIHAKR